VRKLAMLGALAVLAGCGGDGGGLPTLDDSSPSPVTRHPRPATRHPLRIARCPKAATNCAASLGRVIYIESLDPDGDGDLHVVAIATKGDIVTGAGITVFDVSKDIRPKKDPKLGATVTGAGPVYRGSHGQKQIQVTKFRVQH
jgi:hypothetical protein